MPFLLWFVPLKVFHMFSTPQSVLCKLSQKSQFDAEGKLSAESCFVHQVLLSPNAECFLRNNSACESMRADGAGQRRIVVQLVWMGVEKEAISNWQSAIKLTRTRNEKDERLQRLVHMAG